jgi:biotin synthase-related radical SAM superfamily protein
LDLLSSHGLRFVPHIVLGLHYGRFLGEHRALEMLTRYPVSTIVLVVLMPLAGTPMAGVPRPRADQVADFWCCLDHDAVASVVAGSGAADALGVPADTVTAAVIEAGRQACRRHFPEPNLPGCISMVTHGHVYCDTCEIAREVAERVGTPVPVLVAPPTLNRERLESLKSIGVDMIGVGLDAVTEDLFRAIRTDVPAGGPAGSGPAGSGPAGSGPKAGGPRWDRCWEGLDLAREIFGPWKVNVHTVVGLGESDRALLGLFATFRDRQIFPYLFCSNPEPGSRMAAHPKPPLRRWRRVQLARHLTVTEGYGLERFVFDDSGGLACLRVERPVIETVVAEGTAFTTNGCLGEDGEPGCTRPYGSYRPVEPFRDYPFAPVVSDLEDVRPLCLDDIVQ